jgi:hypothetical protein
MLFSDLPNRGGFFSTRKMETAAFKAFWRAHESKFMDYKVFRADSGVFASRKILVGSAYQSIALLSTSPRDLCLDVPFAMDGMRADLLGQQAGLKL